MAIIYLANIKPHRANQGRLGSRGYTIQRVGKTVRLSWGPISLTNNRKLHWAGYKQRQLVRTFATTREASDWAAAELKRKCQPGELRNGYRPLEQGEKIHPRD